MGKVTDYLLNMIQKQLDDRGIVIWYDPEGTYSDFVRTLLLPDTPILRYDGSFFLLREQLEPYLEFVNDAGRPTLTDDKRRILTYVPLGRSETDHALIEAESAGTFLEPGASPWQRNTRLAVIAQHYFNDADPARAAEIIKRADQGALSLRDLDVLADQEQVHVSTLELVFDARSAEEIALAFAASDSRDKEVADRQALPDLARLLEADLGIKVPIDSAGEARLTLQRLLLLTDFLVNLPPHAVLEQLDAAGIPASPTHRDTARRICVNWRNRHDLRSSYADAANAVAQSMLPSRFAISPESLVTVETFSFVDDMLLADAQRRLLEGASDAVVDLATHRKMLFWPTFDGSYQVRWALLETAARLQSATVRVQDQLKTTKTASAMFEAYTRHQDPWSQIDTFHRHLERQYARFDPELQEDHDAFARVMHEGRRVYIDTVASCAETFVGALENSAFSVAGVLRQREIFSRCIELSKDTVAYVLVDALRFEMAHEMLGSLGENLDASLTPALAQLPTITPVGMAALLPRAQQGMELVQAGKGAAIKIAGTTLGNRAARMKFLDQAVGGKVVDLKLNDLTKPSKGLRESIRGARLIVVTSQEIDRWGEDADDEDEARRHMDEVLDKLRRGIRVLASLGVSEFVIAADHGYLFAEALGEDRLLDVPNGAEVDRHRRVWIGRGGQTPPNCIRVAAASVGLGGELELVWPRGYAGFRTPGSRVYFHGGPSLQEIIVPVLTIRARATQAEMPGVVRITSAPEQVTTRFCSVTLVYSKGLIGSEERRVWVVARVGGKEVGTAVAAKYGYNEDPGELTLRHDEENTATLMLNVGPGTKALSVHVLDAATQIELDQKKGIAVRVAL